MTNPTTPTISGISHIDLTVTDLDRSEAFYTELFELSRVLDGRNDEQHLASRYLVHPASMLILGLVQHDSVQQDRVQQDRVQQDRVQQDRVQQDRVQQDRVQQDKVPQDNGQAGFDERHVGLDHLSFNVMTSQELVAWRARLDDHGVDHSGISEGDLWDVLVFRDPDNIQLELFYMKPAAAALLVS